MGKLFKIIPAILVLQFAGVMLVAAEEPSSTEVKLEQVPAAAQKTIQAHADSGEGKISEIDLVVDDGETSYDVTLVKGKEERSFSVAPDGKMLSWQVFMNEIPEAARKTIRQHVRNLKAKLEEVDRVIDDGKTNYEVDLTKEGRDFSFTVAESGKLLFMDVTLEETPEAPQKAIRAQLGDGTITSIEKDMEDEDGSVVYDVEAKKGGKKISFSVDAGGKLVED
jgi:uncharacterized membrane protein YkoI